MRVTELNEYKRRKQSLELEELIDSGQVEVINMDEKYSDPDYLFTEAINEITKMLTEVRRNRMKRIKDCMGTVALMLHDLKEIR